jgi:nucleoside-diphosphate-sugar epimerase
MKVLIAGGSGLLGKELSEKLSKKYEIYSTYRSLKPVKKLKNLKYLKISLENQINLKINPDVIINCTVTSKFSKKNKLMNYIDSNIMAPYNLINFARKKKVKKFINFSTLSVYSNKNKKKITEYNEINFNNLLSKTKYFGEILSMNQKISTVNLRLPGVLNQNLKKNNSWINYIIKKIKKNENLKVYNLKKNFNSVIQIKSVIEIVDKIIQSKKKLNTSLNIVPIKPAKIIEILNTIKKNFNSSSSIINLKNNEYVSFYCGKKLKAKLNVVLPSTISIIKNQLKYYK